jgi:hypothetical protein
MGIPNTMVLYGVISDLPIFLDIPNERDSEWGFAQPTDAKLQTASNSGVDSPRMPSNDDSHTWQSNLGPENLRFIDDG